MRARLGLAAFGVILAATFAAAYQAAPPGAAPKAAPPSASISGLIVDGETGAPVRGAEVIFNLLVQRGTGLFANGPEWSRFTNAAGRFAITPAPIGRMRMHVKKEGYLDGLPGQLGPSDRSDNSWFFLDVARGEQVKDVTVKMWRASTIKGVVEDEARDPIVGERVQLLQRRADQGPGSTDFGPGAAPANTDDHGRFQFVDVRPGEYYVLVPSLQSAAGRRGMPQHPSVFHPNALRLDDATVIRIGSGETLEGVNVTVGTGARRTMVVAGRLMGPADRIGSVEVRLIEANAPRGLETYASVRARTESDGTFKFPSVTPGQYRLHVDAVSTRMRNSSGLARNLTTEQAVDVLWADETIAVDERDVTDLVVPLRTGARIRGRLTFDNANPRPSPDELAWTSVYFQPEDRSGWTSWAPVDASGTFASAALPPGHYYLVWERQGIAEWTPSTIRADGRDAARAVELGTADLNVEFVMESRLTKVAGTVSDTQGRPVTLARVLVFPRDRSRWGAHPAMWLVHRAALNSKSQFSVQVPPGDYLVAAVSSVPANWSAPEFLDTLVPRATRATPAAGERIELSLRVLTTP